MRRTAAGGATSVKSRALRLASLRRLIRTRRPVESMKSTWRRSSAIVVVPGRPQLRDFLLEPVGRRQIELADHNERHLVFAALDPKATLGWRAGGVPAAGGSESVA